MGDMRRFVPLDLKYRNLPEIKIWSPGGSVVKVSATFIFLKYQNSVYSIYLFFFHLFL